MVKFIVYGPSRWSRPKAHFVNWVSETKDKIQERPEFFFFCMAWGMLIIMFFLFFGVILFECIATLVGKGLGTGTHKDKAETLKFIGLGMGGILAAIGAVAYNRRANAEVENNRLTEKGHIEDRFKTATDNLQSKHPVIQISAFYQFYYLAKHSNDIDFRKNIFDVLCAHLRHITQKENRKKHRQSEEITEKCQILLYVLFKSENRTIFEFDRFPTCNLHGIHLVGANLSQARLRRVNLSEADLSNAYISGADFSNAYLSGTIFSSAYLVETCFTGANLSGANFTDANLLGANFGASRYLTQDGTPGKIYEPGANLSGANLSGANLKHTFFSDANFQKAQFKGPELKNIGRIERADFRGATVDSRPILREDLPTDRGEYYANWNPPPEKKD